MTRTVTAELTPRTDTTPAVADVPARDKSGAHWVGRFPGSASLDDLAAGFRAGATAFIGAIQAAGGRVTVVATYRPRERAYLMHYSAKINSGDLAPSAVPPMPGVNIDWVHDTPAASKAAARAMVAAYGIVFPPALVSRHTERAAVDMTITGIIGKSILDATGQEVVVKKMSDLHAVGASYGVHKLVSDPPHWSDDGH
ncbi:hypothetical protein [uncultured Aquabacterium sp.]|uniref:hypothetical protein n=1 Tax=Aquabacterium commune TaxID=70586 RepID=UPI0030D06C14